MTFTPSLCYDVPMRFLPVLLAFAALAAAPVSAAKHHTHSPGSRSAATAHQAQIEARHRIALAAKEKKAWRMHLAKLRSLPHAERVAEKHHEKKWQHKHDEKVAKLQQAKVHEAKLIRRHHHAAALVASTPKPRHAAAAKAIAAKKIAAKKIAAKKIAAKKIAAKSSLAHVRHLAALEAAQAESAQKRLKHEQNAARQAQIAQAWAERRRAIAALHQEKMVAASRAHLENVIAQRKQRVANGHAKWEALHGDGSGGKSLRFWQTGAAGVPVKVISVDLNDPNVKVSAVMAARGNGTAEPFRQMIDRSRPNVAVTGTFFSLDDLQPVGDIVIDGTLVHFGGMGTALCITPANRATMVTCQWGRHHDWSPFDFVVACGPRLLHDGRVVLDARAERFRDQHMLAPNSRIAVGITRGNTLFFVMTHSPIYLGKLARVMQSLGAADAMNLDAGTSTGFYYNGATLARPGRKLTNMIVVYGRRDHYQHALGQLSPLAYHHHAASRPRPAHFRTAAL